MRIGIAGAGFSGAIVARELAELGDYKVVVFDERNHVAGNCHTTRDSDTGVLIHYYGPHIFHTSRQDVWDYVNKYAKFIPYTNRVKAVTHKGLYSLPINLLTINQFFGKRFNPEEAKEFVASLGDKSINQPKNFEEQALKMLGRDLYEAFFRGYTIKQWGVDPTELPASILARLPVRFNYDDNYFNDRYQGIPEEGYTELVRRILDHPNIEVRLNERFPIDARNEFSHTFFTGPIDSFFEYKFGRLGYRTVVFEKFVAQGDFQGNAVINYCEPDVPYTRVTEHKHFAPWETHEKSICYREYSKATEPNDIPFYPLRLVNDKTTLQSYIELAQSQENLTFLGRLATYRYLDMHLVIAEALDAAKAFLSTRRPDEKFPALLVNPL